MKKLLFLCLCFASQICLNAAKSNPSKSESRKPFEETDYRLNLQRLATMPFYNPHNSDQSTNRTFTFDRSLNSPRNYAEGKDNRNS